MSLIAKNITKLYGTQKALDNVSFEIATGEIVGFLGPNGAGKSTMMKIITGYINQNEGKVLVNDLDTSKNIIDIRRQVGYLPEHNPLYLNMYVREYLNFVARVYKIKGNIPTQVSNIIEMTGLTREFKKKIGALSKGYRQRVGLAAALVHDPEVLILDEPTTGLDPNQIIEIRNLISEVGKKKTVMLSTHIMQEVEALCNRVIIIDKGVIVADKPVEKISDISHKNTQMFFVEFNKAVPEDRILSINGVNYAKQVDEHKWALTSDVDVDIRPAIFNFAVAEKLILMHLQKEEKSMEDIFRELTLDK